MSHCAGDKGTKSVLQLFEQKYILNIVCVKLTACCPLPPAVTVPPGIKKDNKLRSSAQCMITRTTYKQCHSTCRKTHQMTHRHTSPQSINYPSLIQKSHFPFPLHQPLFPRLVLAAAFTWIIIIWQLFLILPRTQTQPPVTPKLGSIRWAQGPGKSTREH